MDVAKNNFLSGAAQAAGTLTTMAAAPHVVAAASKVDDYFIDRVRSNHLITPQNDDLNTLSGPIATTAAVLVVMGATTIGVACAAFASLIELRSLIHKWQNS